MVPKYLESWSTNLETKLMPGPLPRSRCDETFAKFSSFPFPDDFETIFRTPVDVSAAADDFSSTSVRQIHLIQKRF